MLHGFDASLRLKACSQMLHRISCAPQERKFRTSLTASCRRSRLTTTSASGVRKTHKGRQTPPPRMFYSHGTSLRHLICWGDKVGAPTLLNLSLVHIRAHRE